MKKQHTTASHSSVCGGRGRVCVWGGGCVCGEEGVCVGGRGRVCVCYSPGVVYTMRKSPAAIENSPSLGRSQGSTSGMVTEVS